MDWWIVAQGKTADKAIRILEHTLELQDAGVIGVELEVVPPKVAEVVTQKVDIMTLSMGSGSGCTDNIFSQMMYLDILGHILVCRIYKDFKKNRKLQRERGCKILS